MYIVHIDVVRAGLKLVALTAVTGIALVGLELLKPTDKGGKP